MPINYYVQTNGYGARLNIRSLVTHKVTVVTANIIMIIANPPRGVKTAVNNP